MAIRQKKGDPKNAAKFMRSFDGLTMEEQMALARWIQQNKLLEMLVGMGELELREGTPARTSSETSATTTLSRLERFMRSPEIQASEISKHQRVLIAGAFLADEKEHARAPQTPDRPARENCPLGDPYSEAFRRIWDARRAGRPVPPIDELLPPDEHQSRVDFIVARHFNRPHLRLVYSRE